MRVRRTVHLLGGPEDLRLDHLGVAALARWERGLHARDAGPRRRHLLGRVRGDAVPVLRAIVAAHLLEQRRGLGPGLGPGPGLGLGLARARGARARLEGGDLGAGCEEHVHRARAHVGARVHEEQGAAREGHARPPPDLG